MNEELHPSDAPTIVDVRTRVEFMSGNVAGSVNIPLQEIPERLEEIMALPQPLALCCASGSRSAQATAFLSARGVECSNAGSWTTVQYKLLNSLPI